MQDNRSSAVVAHFHRNAGVQLEFAFEHFPRDGIKGSLFNQFHTAFLCKSPTVVYVKIHLRRRIARFLHILIRVFYTDFIRRIENQFSFSESAFLRPIKTAR